MNYNEKDIFLILVSTVSFNNCCHTMRGYIARFLKELAGLRLFTKIENNFVPRDVINTEAQYINRRTTITNFYKARV